MQCNTTNYKKNYLPDQFCLPVPCISQTRWLVHLQVADTVAVLLFAVEHYLAYVSQQIPNLYSTALQGTSLSQLMDYICSQKFPLWKERSTINWKEIKKKATQQISIKSQACLMNKENRKLYRSLYFSSLSNQNLLELFHREKSSFSFLKVSGGTTIPESFSGHLEFKRLKCSWSGINRVKVCANT